MSIPLHSKKIISLPMTKIILDEYLEARKDGLSVTHSKQWAAFMGESIRFGGSIRPNLKSKRREKSVWYRGTSKHAKVETFDRLMKNALGTTRFFGKPKTTLNWILSALKRHNKTMWADINLAAGNYENIVERSPTDPKFFRTYHRWLKIRRGRNLFVRGWGKFDISAAVQRLGHMPINPIEISACGYEMSAWLFKAITTNANLKKYYARHLSFWRENKNRLDEMIHPRSIQRILENPDVSPETILREIMQLWQDRFSNHGYSPEPFAHLAEAPTIDTPFGTLQPLRDPQKVREVGLAMRNCATNYIPSIRQKSCLLLALLDRDGRPIALGEVRYDHEAKRWIWGQRLGPDNKNLEENLRDVFATYPLAASGIWEQLQDRMIQD